MLLIKAITLAFLAHCYYNLMLDCHRLPWDLYVYMYDIVHVCMSLCAYVCMYACHCIQHCVGMYVHVCMCIFMYECMHACMYVFLHRILTSSGFTRISFILVRLSNCQRITCTQVLKQLTFHPKLLCTKRLHSVDSMMSSRSKLNTLTTSVHKMYG